MWPALRFLLVLLPALAGLAWTAAELVERTGRSWFDRDVELRAELALRGAHQEMVRAWRGAGWTAVSHVLEEITRDERILGALACDEAGKAVARTGALTERGDCSSVRRWAGTASTPRPFADGLGPESARSRVHVSGVPLIDTDGPLGTVFLLHDMTFADRRAVLTRWFTLGAFGVVAVLAALVTVLAVRFSWHSWTRALARQLRGGSSRREFQPLLRDLRDLVARLSSESVAAGGGAWTADRLRRVLNQEMHGERVVIVANREPYIHERGADGKVHVVHPASGLVTALEPVMRACSGVWVAHGSGSADRDTADRHGRLRVPPGEDAYQLRRVWLTREQEHGYYYGFSNEGLWALCHVAHARPTFRSDDWQHYREVNAAFAAATVEEADGPDPIVLVQDYHFALAPTLLRERLPHATVLTFWHIPWPSAERFGICPWSRELLEGLLGSSIVGFHTQQHCNNFLEAVDKNLEARIDREQQAVVHRGHTTFVRPYPISIEWPNSRVVDAPSPAACRARVLSELRLPPDTLLGIGVDRLDYTKGIEERLLAVERLLERFPHLRGRFRFVQLAAPSRTVIERYRELDRTIEATAARINARFAAGVGDTILLLRAHHEPPAVFRYYRAADVCYVSSLHDGMNLVAKEFIAARDDERGVLVLSEFTGAARELTEALLVNPYDLEQASAALALALSMSPEEQAERMRSMRSLLSHFNVYRWAGRMLSDAARLRRHDRVTTRISRFLKPQDAARR